MAEIIQRAGVWAFDGSTIRIAPGAHRSVPPFRQTYGEITVPIEAVAGVSLEPDGKHSRLRLALREAADPLLQATGGMLPENADPYRLPVDRQSLGAAEYVLEEIRQTLLLEQVPKGRAETYLLPGPTVPLTVTTSDGVVSFDGSRVRIDWASTSSAAKREENPRTIRLADVESVDWLPKRGLDNGLLRFVTAESALVKRPPKEDPWTMDLWGNARRELQTAALAAAVVARLPHPSPSPPDAGKRRRYTAGAPGLAARGEELHDVLLRRLRKLGALHREGVLTDEEFADVKRVVLRGFTDGERPAPRALPPAAGSTGLGASGVTGTGSGPGRGDEEPEDHPYY